MREKQKRFAEEYLMDLNATQAAMRAGYSEKTAYSQGSRLLKHPQVKAYVEEKQKVMQEHLEIRRERVVEEMAKIAFGDIRDLLEWSDEGVSLLPSSRLSDDTAASIAEVKEMASGVTVKQYDKLRALDLMAKMLGLYEEGKEKDTAVPLLVDEP